MRKPDESLENDSKPVSARREAARTRRSFRQDEGEVRERVAAPAASERSILGNPAADNTAAETFSSIIQSPSFELWLKFKFSPHERVFYLLPD